MAVARIAAAGCTALAAMLLAGAPAYAQSMSTNSADFNAGYGRIPGQENRPVEITTRDANGNRIIVDGLILTGQDQSSFASASGAADAYAGVGALSGGASAIGNNLVVLTQGSYNTVIVNSSQVNNGAVTATTTSHVGAANGP